MIDYDPFERLTEDPRIAIAELAEQEPVTRSEADRRDNRHGPNRPPDMPWRD